MEIHLQLGWFVFLLIVAFVGTLIAVGNGIALRRAKRSYDHLAELSREREAALDRNYSDLYRRYENLCAFKRIFIDGGLFHRNAYLVEKELHERASALNEVVQADIALQQRHFGTADEIDRAMLAINERREVIKRLQVEYYEAVRVAKTQDVPVKDKSFKDYLNWVDYLAPHSAPDARPASSDFA